MTHASRSALARLSESKARSAPARLSESKARSALARLSESKARSALARLSETQVCIRRNPFDPVEREHTSIAGPLTLAQLVARCGIDPRQQPVIAEVDGRLVLQRDWPVRTIEAGQFVHLRTLPLGGGGGGSGGGGKDMLRSALLIAVTVAAFAVAGPLAGAIGLSGLVGATAGAAIVSGAIVVGGSLLINTLIPPQPAASGNLGNGISYQQPSPTYSIQSRGNSARLEQPIPVIYGRHIIYPDFAATPWWEYVGNEQYLFQTLVIGQGHYTIEELSIGSSPIDSFDEITTETVQPGAAVTLYDANVYSASEVTGQSAKAANELTGGADGWIGPFAACPPDTLVSTIGIDLVLNRGLYAGASDGSLSSKSLAVRIEARQIDGNGVPLGAYILVDAPTINGTGTRGDATGGLVEAFGVTPTTADPTISGTVTPQRLSFKYSMPSSARWQVRLKRTDTKDTSYRVGHEVSWAGLRGYVGGSASFGAITVIAIRAKATDNLNSNTARQINAVVSRKLPVWTGSTWTDPQETRSIAWAAADVLRNTVYGGKVADTRIDLAGLLALDAAWAERGDTFDAVFDQASTVWEALGKVLRTGRARPYFQAGIVRFHRDAPQTLPVAMFTSANIVQRTLTMDFTMPVSGDSADGVEGQYTDERTWLPASIKRGVDGATPDNPAREQLFGIVTAAQADRETTYMAAANRYRRASISWETELDGLIPSVGDLLLVSHDIPRWGQSGSVKSWNAGTLTVTLDSEVDLGSGASYVRLRSSTGRPSVAVVIASQPAGDTLVLASLPTLAAGGAFQFETDGSKVSTLYAIGTSTESPRRVLVTSLSPRGSRVRISGVVEDDRVHVN